MKIFYNTDSTRIEIPIDYCQKDVMKNLCEILVSTIDETSWWVEGLYLNHALDMDDILVAQRKLEELYCQKHEKMKVSNQGVFLKDNIVLSKKEIIENFNYFAIYYMEVTIRPQNLKIDIIEIGTEADANFIYIYVKKNQNLYIQKILQNIDSVNLEYMQISKCNADWNDNAFNELMFKYPEIAYSIEKKILKLEKDGWIKEKEYVKTYHLGKKKMLFLKLYKRSGECKKIPIMMMQCRLVSSVLEVNIM